MAYVCRQDLAKKRMKRVDTFLQHYLVASGKCIVAFGPGLFSQRYRTLIHKIATHRDTSYVFGAEVSELIPEIRWSQFIESPCPVRVLEPEAANGNVSTLELLCINQWICHKKVKYIFEIGTFDGRTTLNM